MDKEQLAIFEAQQKKQRDDYEKMMKQYGIEVPDQSNEEDELAAIMK